MIVGQRAISIITLVWCLLAPAVVECQAPEESGNWPESEPRAAMLWESLESQLALALVDSLPDDSLSWLLRCRILTMAGEHAAAAAAADDFLSRWPDSPPASDARWMAAFNAAKLGLHRAAAVRFMALAAEDSLLSEIAWLRAAECLKGLGQKDRAGAIMDSLSRRPAMFGDDVDLFSPGRPWSKGPEDRPRAQPPTSRGLRLANRSINRGKYSQALAQLDRFLRENPKGRETGLASYLYGKCYEKMGRLGPAAESYRTVHIRQPGSSYAADGLFRAGWCLYKSNDIRRCLAAWDTLELRYPESRLLAAARYWRLRFARDLGDQQESERLAGLIKNEHRYSYYWWRLAGEGEASSPDGSGSNIFSGAVHTDFSWWLAGRRQYRQALRLLDLGMLDDARYLADRLGETAGNDALALFHLSLIHHRLGLDPEAIVLARRAQSLWMGPRPRQLYEVLYPRRYLETITAESRSHGLDPALVLAVMRQESHFVANARSRAGARGLMQIMPRTGRQLMGARNFKLDTLYHPGTSIHYGTKFLARLVRQFDGSLVRALGAYNAGPHRMNAWLKSPRCRHDEDFLIEDMHLAETRDYIKKVLEGYYVYTWLLGEGRKD